LAEAVTADNKQPLGSNVQTGGGSRWEVEDFSGNDGKVSYQISADIAPSQADNFPVLRVEPAAFSADVIREITSMFLGDKEIYEYSDYLGKAQIEQTILEYKNFADYDRLVDYYDGNTELADSTFRKYNEKIAGLEKLYQEMPEDYEPSPAELTYAPADEDGQELLTGMLFDDDVVYAIRATHRVKGDFRYNGLLISSDWHPQSAGEKYRPEAWSTEEINNITETINGYFKDSGIGSWKVRTQAVQKMEGGYFLYLELAPEYCGVEVLDVGQLISIKNARQSETYRADYYYERCEIRIGAENALLSIYAEGLLEVKETINESVSMLPQDEIFRIAVDQLPVQCTGRNILGRFVQEEEIVRQKIEFAAGGVRITRGELGLMRVGIKDDYESFYLLPVWVFYGELFTDSVLVAGVSREYKSSTLEEFEKEIPILVINAVDGSIIDPQTGY